MSEPNEPEDKPWITCQYFGFYDIPRHLVFQQKGRTFLLNCPFEEEEDEYRSSYYVWELDPSITADQIDALTCDEFKAQKVKQWGDLPTDALVFHRERPRHGGHFFARFYFAAADAFPTPVS